jgi:succinate dehydrogenase / fumarate reductase cytochrome b subunit
MSPLLSTLCSFYQSSIGKKILVGLTGAFLVVFLLGHMIGNLLVFVGPDAINEYGHMLQTAGHGMLVWVARVAIFGCIGLHAWATISLTKANRTARGTERYGCETTQVASKSSRVMIMSGLTILAFFIYHILHFTVHAGNDYGKEAYYTTLHGERVHDVFKMVIDGFSWLPASAFYIIAMVLLCSHLSHGVSSMFQTLGLNTEKTEPFYKKVGWAYALLILVGNCSIPVAIYVFKFGR